MSAIGPGVGAAVAAGSGSDASSRRSISSIRMAMPASSSSIATSSAASGAAVVHRAEGAEDVAVGVRQRHGRQRDDAVRDDRHRVRGSRVGAHVLDEAAGGP